MREVDFSKAPEGATHYCEQEGRATWWREGEDWMFYGDIWLSDRVPLNGTRSGEWFQSNTAGLVLRPIKKAWSGDGLPPVGTVCERCWDSGEKTYCQIIVIAHDEGRAVYRFLDSERRGEYDADLPGIVAECPAFRPIRTPEQIAAEEREKEIGEISDLIFGLDLRNITQRHATVIAEAIHSSGYRKQEPKP